MNATIEKRFARSSMVLGAGAVALALAAFAGLSRGALAAPTPSGSGATSAGSSQSSASAVGSSTPSSVSVKTDPPVVSGSDVPETASDQPHEGDWAKAPHVSPNHGKTSCKILLLRDWLRVECPGATGAGLIAGDPKDVKAWASATDTPNDTSQALVELHLVRGQTRIIGFLTKVEGYNADSFGQGETMSIAWREGHPDPMIIVAKAPFNPDAF